MSLIRRNVEYGPALKLSSWRKIAMGTWRTAGDPSVYGVLDIDAEAALAYMEKLKAATGTRITISHFMGKALASVMTKYPEMNCVLRFGRLYPRKSVDVFFQVATDPEGKDLSGLTIRAAESKSVVEIAREMEERVARIRAYQDKSYTQMKSTMSLIPGIFVGTILTWIGHLLYSLNIHSSLLGVPRDSFGSAMITNIGSLGLDMAFAPLVPYSRVPLLISLGEVKDRPAVRDGKLTVAKQVRMCVTVDHRLIDGMYGSLMAKALLRIFADPEAAFGAVAENPR